MRTDVIRNIDPESLDSYLDKVFLTFDIDWAHDEVLSDTVAIVEKAGVAATWFATHDTPVLEHIRQNQTFELGIHPNFNFLMEGKDTNGINAGDVVDRMMQIVPDAKSVRSHSVTQSSVLMDVFKSAGITHDVNHFIPYHTGIELKPWIMWNGLCRVPYSWEDDVYVSPESEVNNNYLSPSQVALRIKGLKVFDFHPIHVFLNTESLDRYERTRPLHQKPKELIKHRYEGYGTRNRLIELLELISLS
jgi:hypothetical protein